MLNGRMLDIPEIPEQYSIFPDDYINDIRGWGFDELTIQNEAGKLLTLDIDFGARCSLNCPACFRRNNSVDNIPHELKLNDLMRIVREGMELGLRSVKLLGAGEPLENPGIIELLRFLRDVEVVPVLFTKTSIFGDDDDVSSLFGYHGINTGEDLANELFKCNVSVVLGWNSFDHEVQTRMVGGSPQYIAKRNRTLQILVEAGFSDPNPTRLALGVNPITNANLHEAFDIYKWSRLRNIYAIVTPTMISGRVKGTAWRDITPSSHELIDLYTSIYLFNLETNLMTLDQIEHQGISAYAGGHPCNQTACGLYVTLNGIVLNCPGTEEKIEGNIWNTSLGSIWYNSNNFKKRGIFNTACPAKDSRSIPTELYSAVLEKICEHSPAHHLGYIDA